MRFKSCVNSSSEFLLCILLSFLVTTDLSWEDHRFIQVQMNDKVKTSKALSRILRHGHSKVSIPSDGFVSLTHLLKYVSNTSIEAVQEIVSLDIKQRFTLKEEDGIIYIRANQGHSIEVDVEMAIIEYWEDLPELIHGTYIARWPVISLMGLSRMKRLHIHLTTSLTAKSGIRSSCNLYIYVDTRKAMEDGIVFKRSSNDVILTNGVNGILDPKYFSKVVSREGVQYIPAQGLF